MDTQPDTDAFTRFVNLTRDAIPGVADGLRGNRVVSDEQLLGWAADNALGGYPRHLLPQLFIALMDRAPQEVKDELGVLLLSLYQIQGSYSSLNDRAKHGPWYRFEDFRAEGVPEWLQCGTPHGYVHSLVCRAVVLYLVATDDWELPEKIVRQRARDELRRQSTIHSEGASAE